MDLIDIASEFYELKENSYNSFIIKDTVADSVVLFTDTQKYHRFSTGETGDVYQFLKNIVGLSDSEIQLKYDGQVVDTSELNLRNALMRALRKNNTHSVRDNELSYTDVVGKVGYNEYIQSRNITEETANFYNIEVVGPDVLFPLFDTSLNRIGCIRRYAHAKTKADRYRTFILSGYNKPCCWSIPHLLNMNSDTTIVLVEGTWSAMRINQVVGPLYNILPIATMGTELNDDLFQLIAGRKVLAILDRDLGGNRVENQLITVAKRGILKVNIIDLKNSKQRDNKPVYIDEINDTQMLKLFRSIDSKWLKSMT